MDNGEFFWNERKCHIFFCFTNFQSCGHHKSQKTGSKVLLLESHVKLEEFVDRLHHPNVQRLSIMQTTILEFETISLISKIIDIF
jgi:hypothetical protein